MACAIQHRPFSIQLENDEDPIGSWYLVDGLSRNPGNCLSKNNPQRDAETLRRKILGADIKLHEGKSEASNLLDAAIAKILVLRDAYKLDRGAWKILDVSFDISERPAPCWTLSFVERSPRTERSSRLVTCVVRPYQARKMRGISKTRF